MSIMSYDVTFKLLTKLHNALTFSITLQLQHHTQAIFKVLPFFTKTFGSSILLLWISVKYPRQHSDINKCWNIVPKGCKLASQIGWYHFFSLGGPYKAIKLSIY
jgi:hypothetical protein